MITATHSLRSIANVVLAMAALVMASMVLFSMIAAPQTAPARFGPTDLPTLTFVVALAIVSGVLGWRSWRRRSEGSAAFLLIIHGAACLMLVACLALYVVNL
ncbi:hypothetical protein [Dyella telluris]|uniref:Uncharacterized protein n=1 Tax=Dyella telluris TaxID=2763498 RepID=A0A7G8Q7X7_9GAMM|nr:hypothetical protein [Dyella telluris]QNK02885.1 hypothetical protein H8F01_07130 [Dyella telluris]